MSGLDILFGDKFARIGVIINEPERVSKSVATRDIDFEHPCTKSTRLTRQPKFALAVLVTQASGPSGPLRTGLSNDSTPPNIAVFYSLHLLQPYVQSSVLPL